MHTEKLVVSSLSSGSVVAALLHQLSAALLLQRLPGHLLLHIRALLSGGGGALPGTHSGALLVILVPGHGDGDRVADLLGDLITDLTGGAHVITDLLGHWVADLSEVVCTLAVADLLGAGLGHEGADAAGLGLAVLDGHLLARLPVQLLAVHFGHLDTPQLGLVAALLLGEGPALPLGDLVALAPGDIRAFLPFHSLALPLIDLLALLSWHLPALLLGLLRALLLTKVALGADLGVDSVTLPLVGGGALLTGDIPALLLGHPGALSLVHHTALLHGDVVADLLLDGVALPLGDHLTLPCIPVWAP